VIITVHFILMNNFLPKYYFDVGYIGVQLNGEQSMEIIKEFGQSGKSISLTRYFQ